MTSDYTFNIQKFHDLTVDELYNILTLRQQIFVVEQQCIYLDNDDLDQISEHVTCYAKNTLIAYLRIIPANTGKSEIVIGRVVCHEQYRKAGIGKSIMTHAINYIGSHPIKIGAQAYLKKFYSELGFKQTSEEYDLDGIPHIDMLLMPS